MWNEISWRNWTKTSHERISFRMVFENKIIIHLQLVGKSLKDTEAFDYQIDAESFSRVKFLSSRCGVCLSTSKMIFKCRVITSYLWCNASSKHRWYIMSQNWEYASGTSQACVETTVQWNFLSEDQYFKETFVQEYFGPWNWNLITLSF